MRHLPAADEWARLWLQSAVLMTDTAAVVALRTMRMMGGGSAATTEMQRMVGEKIEAGFEFAGAVASGSVTTPEATARKALGVMGKRVRANRKRLA